MSSECSTHMERIVLQYCHSQSKYWDKIIWWDKIVFPNISSEVLWGEILNWKYPKLIINYIWVTDLQRSTQTTPSNINIWCYITPDCGGIPLRLTLGWQWHNNIQWSAPAITLTVWQQGCCQGFPPPLSPVSLCVPVVVSCWGYCSYV